MTSRILIGSPIHQKPNILQEFLTSLKELDNSDLDIGYVFIDDNVNPTSSQLLENFSLEFPDSLIIESSMLGIAESEKYICDDFTHKWSESLIWKVAAFKNFIIDIAIEENVDYLFLIDSDLVLHPLTVAKLVEAKKQIISEIFWTQWQPPHEPALPQVWWSDHYNLVPKGRWEILSDEEANIRQEGFLSQLKTPGIYPVGGLGACTLIAKTALQKGVNFSEIPNLSFRGEDRHFCIRATALGFFLYVDTHYPAYHIYRESDLSGVAAYKS